MDQLAALINRVAAIKAHHAELDELLDQAVEKAKADPDFVGYATAFVGDAELKVAEAIGWMHHHVKPTVAPELAQP